MTHIRPPLTRWLVALCLTALLGLPPAPVAPRAAAQVAPTTPPCLLSPDIGNVKLATAKDLPNVILMTCYNRSAESWSPPEYTLDGGATWHRVANTPWTESLSEIALVRRVDGTPRIIVGAGDTLYRTGDFGQSWAALQLNRTITDLAVSPVDSAYLYLGSVTPLGFPDPAFTGYLEGSSDAGLTWKSKFFAADMGFGPMVASPITPTLFYVHRYGWSPTWLCTAPCPSSNNIPTYADLALDATNPNWLYAVPYYGSTETPKRSSDGGVTWSDWTTLPDDVYIKPIVAHPTKTGILYYPSRKLYRSLDPGDTWEMIHPTRGFALVADYGQPGRLLWARSDGLWASVDDGTTWQRLSAGKVFLPVVIQ